MAGVLCVGIATLDYAYSVDTIPSTPIKHRAKALTVIGGGLSANAAVAVARLGGPSFMASRLGRDLAGDEIFASATAAIKCTRYGGRAGAPGEAEVREFLRRA